MAAREDTVHSKRVRARIQTSQLITRLETNALSDEEIMTTGQIQSARICLDKSMPNLQASAEVNEQGELCPVSWDK